MNKAEELSLKELKALVTNTPAERLPLPIAYADPAFNRCMLEACATPELIEQFDRLTGSKLGRIASGSNLEKMIDEATGFRDDQLRKFVEFVHESVYMRAPNEAINAFRLAAIVEPEKAPA